MECVHRIFPLMKSNVIATHSNFMIPSFDVGDDNVIDLTDTRDSDKQKDEEDGKQIETKMHTHKNST